MKDYKDDILIVAGGGGGGRNQANHIPDARWGTGGSGGGYIGGGAVSNAGTFTNMAGTQSSRICIWARRKWSNTVSRTEADYMVDMEVAQTRAIQEADQEALGI